MMNEEELAQLLADVGLIDNEKPQLSDLTFNLLKPLGVERVKEAIAECLIKSPYGVKLHDIFAQVHYKDKQRAEKAFHNLVKSKSTTADFIIADWKSAVTIRALYGSPQRFNERPVESVNNDQSLKYFVERYLEVQEDEADLENKQCFFKGTRNGMGKPYVEFIGDYNTCIRIVRKVYGDDLPRLPHDPNTKPQRLVVENRGKPMDIEKQKALLENVAKRLGFNH